MKNQSTGQESRITRGQLCLNMFTHWQAYAESLRAECGRGPGDDSFMGPIWAGLGSDLRGMLSGSPEGVDAAALDAQICAELEREGFNPDDIL